MLGQSITYIRVNFRISGKRQRHMPPKTAVTLLKAPGLLPRILLQMLWSTNFHFSLGCSEQIHSCGLATTPTKSFLEGWTNSDSP
jgi:hypothetical protein